jgi:predicted signal transduction protein with EAL and GGDEF domain
MTEPDAPRPNHHLNELDLYKMMVNAALDSITLIDRSYTYRIVTDAYLNAREMKKDRILNRTVADVWGEEAFEKSIKPHLDACFRGQNVTTRASYEFRKNELNYIETIYSPCFTSDSEVAYAAVISRNITELKKSQEKIAFLAYYDSLTTLPSRPLFLDLLNREINNANRTGKSLAVFFFDLDEFKKINDTFGHSAGDQLLISVGRRLKSCLRPRDVVGRIDWRESADHRSGDDYLARIGGDEFTFIIPEIVDQKATTGIAERILDLFKEPFPITEREIFITTSIGIAFYPGDGTDVETLLKNADVAMYKAKEAGKNTFRYYSADMNEKARERMTIEHKMRYAIKNNEFRLHYQPQHQVETGALTGAEALIRWEDRELGAVATTSLVQLAEETGMIVDIGEWAVRSACRQGKIWHAQGFDRLRMAVNLSVRQFYDQSLVDKIRAALVDTGFDPAFLELEITETAMMLDTRKAIAIMDALKHLGVRIALDDFGTGYSSLVHLKLFHIDKLKIDQVFIRNADFAGRDGAIISSIVDLCHKLKIEAVAEGVETTEALNFLTRIRCHLAQGFLFSPALSAAKFADLLTGGG